MTQNIEYSLSEILGKIDNRLDKLDQKIDNLSKDINDIKIDVATVKEGQNGLNKRLDDWKPIITQTTDKTENLSKDINNLSEKVGKLKNWRQLAIIIVTGFITSLFWIFRSKIFTF